MIKEKLYRDEQVTQLARRLNLSKSVVEDVLINYVKYLRHRLDDGLTVKFLNVCYIVIEGKQEELHETLAYTASKIADNIGIDRNIAYRVLASFEEYLIRDLRNFYSYNIRGLFTIKLKNLGEGYGYKLRLKKSCAYKGTDCHITAINSFKRKVEMP